MWPFGRSHQFRDHDILPAGSWQSIELPQFEPLTPEVEETLSDMGWQRECGPGYVRYSRSHSANNETVDGDPDMSPMYEESITLRQSRNSSEVSGLSFSVKIGPGAATLGAGIVPTRDVQMTLDFLMTEPRGFFWFWSSEADPCFQVNVPDDQPYSIHDSTKLIHEFFAFFHKARAYERYGVHSIDSMSWKLPRIISLQTLLAMMTRKSPIFTVHNHCPEEALVHEEN